MGTCGTDYTRYQTLATVIFIMTILGGAIYYSYTENFWISGPAAMKAPMYSRYVAKSGDGSRDGPRDGTRDGTTTMTSRETTGHPIEDGQQQEPKDAQEQELEVYQQQEDEYRARITRYQDVCAVRKADVNSRRDVLYYNNPLTNRSLSFCPVPKVGSTFWRRIFQFLNQTNKTEFSSPLDLPRRQVHHHPLVKLRSTTYNDDLMINAIRFFFARDPYARLISAYVDKFLLLQFATLGVYGKEFLKPEAKLEKQPCVKDISFAAFIEKIVLSVGNVHWKPVHRVCDPCKFSPQIIGKQETFSRDAKYILNKVGLQHVMAEYSHETYVGDELKQVVDFAYSLRDANGYIRKCFNNIDIASKLWRAFQINGYLPPNIMFPKNNMKASLKDIQDKTSKVKDAVANFIVKENARAGLSHDQHSKQKRDMMVGEFATLSKDTMEKLADMYDGDFRMFGYEKYPRDLFPWKYVAE